MTDDHQAGRRRAPATVFSGVARLLAALVAFAALALAHPRAAAAHTHLRESSPGAGQTVSPDVHEVRLRFSEAVEPAFTSVTLAGPNGATASAGSLGFPADGHGRVAVLPLTAPLAPGRWTVTWKAAAADGHPTAGSFSFIVAASAASPANPTSATVQHPSPAPAYQPISRASDSMPLDVVRDGKVLGMDADDGAATESMHHDSPLDVAIRWLGLAALLAMVGAVAFHFAVAQPVRSAASELVAEVDGRAATLAMWAVLVSLPVLFLRLWAEGRAMSGMGPAGGSLSKLLTGTSWGHAWLLQEVATAFFVAGIVPARQGRRGGWAVAAIAAFVLAGVPALSGHAAAADHAAVAVAADWLHVLAAAAWLGSLLTLLVAALPVCARLVDGGAEGLALLVSRFSPFALAAAGTAALTGVVSATLRLSAFAQLWSTGYGRMLLVKLALVLAVAMVGVYNWRVVRPALGTDAASARLRRSATAEIALGALVVLATAILVALPTP